MIEIKNGYILVVGDFMLDSYYCFQTSKQFRRNDQWYSFVWGQEHTTAERDGDSTTNFIEWVNACVAAETE